MFLKKRNETPQPDRAGNPSGSGVFLCFFLHKIAIEQKADPQSGGGFGCEKRKSRKNHSIRRAGSCFRRCRFRQILLLVSVKWDKTVRFTAGEKCRLKITAGFWNIMRAASACLHNMADCSLWGRESGLFRIPGRRCGWKGESIR